jgi:hypothetical protein
MGVKLSNIQMIFSIPRRTEVKLVFLLLLENYFVVGESG